ncbi:MAG: hypothetical protein DMF62_10765 [Acidobacteria bacterium]|nr:MAG: hypothetical protein DMF62_10765 [Acidobacteriota bacterium]
MRIIFGFSALIILFAGSLFSQAPAPGFDLANYGVTIEPDKRVILVLAALDTARTENEKGEPVPVISTRLSEPGKQFRELLISDLAGMSASLRQRISAFVLGHKRRHPEQTDEQLIAPFISMAYTLGPVPDLADPVITTDLPGNLLDVLDFAPLVRDLYRTTNIGANLNEYVKQYRTVSDAVLRPSARVMVSELLGYLHTKPQLTVFERVRTETLKTNQKKSSIANTERRERQRRFIIVPEMLAPLGYVNFVNVKDDYYAVVPAGADLTSSEVRRAFLQFTIDPIILGVAKEIETVRPAIKQLLDERRKIDPSSSPDVLLTISRSLVAAIDTKQLESIRSKFATQQARERIAQVKTEAEKLAVSAELEKYKKAVNDEALLRLSEDYEKGAILAFYFADQLRGLEESDFDISSSIKEMIAAFDAAKETGRYESYADARARAKAAREDSKKNVAKTPSIIENPVSAKLLEIQELIKAKDYTKAESNLKQLLVQNPSEPRIFYNLGRVAALTAGTFTDPADAEKQNTKILEAKNAFEKVVVIASSQRVDPALVSLAYVALGRIYEINDQKEYAIRIYDAALKIGDVSGSGYAEALAAKQRLVKSPQ